MIQTKDELFNKIIECIKNSDLKLYKESKDGRVNSITDEKIIINYLKSSEVGKYVIDDSELNFKNIERKVGDMYLKDPNNNEPIVINIKTSNGKSADNVFSKLGLLIAFTDIPLNNLPKSINWEKMTNLLLENRKEVFRDYYYLYVDKNNTKNCLIRGMKKINQYKTNPSNILQINWENEYVLFENNLSENESYNYIIKLISESLKKDLYGKQFFIDKLLEIY